MSLKLVETEFEELVEKNYDYQISMEQPRTFKIKLRNMIINIGSMLYLSRNNQKTYVDEHPVYSRKDITYDQKQLILEDTTLKIIENRLSSKLTDKPIESILLAKRLYDDIKEIYCVNNIPN